ncbi:hypothetical protein M7I_2494 [Glarea lozoyensis 74030]|uniref:Uncharacterized protein n=1 Tax=Glarea lozoyensis (strain ATCC 74030 / MF5533) TaxID=1104152 RepID=H0EIX5_GLAL7|nr:hypothetical protein M7I_2494 [Glarea lozoyensis 74030]
MTPFKYIFAFLSLALIALATPIAEKAEVLSDLQSDGYNTTLSSLAPRNKDGVHCCKDNGRGWKYAPVKNFDRARNDLFFTPNLKIKIGPRGCGATFGGCDAGTVVEICNDSKLHARSLVPFR